MAEQKNEEPTPPPLPHQIDPIKYHAELRKELADLEFSQAMVWSQYKQDRINRLRGRLGITVN